MGSADPGPVLIDSDAETCTHLFSFHTPLACEQMVSPLLANERDGGDRAASELLCGSAAPFR